MWEFAIYAFTFILALFIAVIYLYHGSRKQSSIPGMEPCSELDGNLPDISRAGSLHQFLLNLHKTYGDIASFWMGRQFIVSICSPELFKEHKNVFDRPPELFRLFEPLLGPKSIQFANKGDARKRRNNHDKILAHAKLKGHYSTFQEEKQKSLMLDPEFQPHLPQGQQVLEKGPILHHSSSKHAEAYTSNLVVLKYLLISPNPSMFNTVDTGFTEIADSLEKKWSQLGVNEHIPLGQDMKAYILRIVLLTFFGDHFKTEKEVIEFGRLHDTCWSEIGSRLTDPETDCNSPQQKVLDEAVEKLRSFIKRVVDARKRTPPNQESELLIDLLIDNAADEEELLSDSVTYFAGGFYSTSNILTWGFYFLATHQDVQDKVVQEIKKVLGKDDVDASNISELVYLRQVIDETLRCAVIAPWVARFQDIDSQLGGHTIPKYTPVIYALGVGFQNEKYWPMPNQFDPDRFSEENVKNRPTLAFQPFGFAGKRICPGYRFAYADTTVCFVTLLRKFKVKMVEGQVVTPVYGFITRPKEEILITIEKR